MNNAKILIPRVGVPIPTVGRAAILDIVIKCLESQADVECVPLIITHESDIIEWAKSRRVGYIECENILGLRWNAGFKYFRDLGVDYMMLLGSDDLLSKTWCISLINEMTERKIRAIGKEQYYFLDIGHGGAKRMCRWDGYKNERVGETVGAGRMFSVEAMNLVDWMPFEDRAMSGLDESMTKKFELNGAKIYSAESDVFGMGVTCFMWRSKRQYHHMESVCEKIPWYNIDRFIIEKFPEFYELNLGIHYAGYQLEARP